MWKIAVAICLALVGLPSWAKSMAGDYVDAAGRGLTLRPSGNWTMSNGMAGTYKVDGDTLILSGLPGGASLAADIEGETSLALRDRNLVTGAVKIVRFARREAAAAETSTILTAPALAASLGTLPACARIDVTATSAESDRDVLRWLAFTNDTVFGRDSPALTPNHQLAEKAERLIKMAGATQGALLPGAKPKNKSWEKTVMCQAWPNPKEIFCRSEGFSGEDFLTVVMLRHGAVGWSCKTYPVTLKSYEGTMGANPKQMDEALSAKDLQQLSKSNPYFVWGAKNRCKWDKTFAVTDPACKRS